MKANVRVMKWFRIITKVLGFIAVVLSIAASVNRLLGK